MGHYLIRWKKKQKKYKLKDNIRFIGRYNDTAKIYAISDITINCSIKEGLALTSYESVSMGVPVISSDVGGQKELINKDVGVIVDCLQEEKDVGVFVYSKEEVNSYVKGLEKIKNNLNKYKSKCRKRILEGFTISQMQKNMNKILIDIAKNPNKEKIQNGKNLKKCIDVTKELIVKEYVQIRPKYEHLCNLFLKNYEFGIFSDTEMLKIRLWESPIYRTTVRFLKKIGIFGLGKKILKKNKHDD